MESQVRVKKKNKNGYSKYVVYSSVNKWWEGYKSMNFLSKNTKSGVLFKLPLICL